MSYNVLHDELDVDREDQHPGYSVGGTLVGKRLGTEELGVTLYVLPPGNANAPYHWHHAIEELLLVLAGSPTLRTPDGKRRLAAGDMISFRRGAEGAHKVVNETSEPVRYLIFSTKPACDVVEYPDSTKIGYGSRGQEGRILRDEPTLDYWDGE